MLPARPPNRGYDTARALGPLLEVRLSSALGPVPDRLTFTWWEQIKATGGGNPHYGGSGLREDLTLEEFAGRLTWCAYELREKHGSRVFVHGVSLWGGSEDAQCARIDCIWFDCDAKGDWLWLLSALDRLGIAYVASRSGGHRDPTATDAGVFKWHVHIPLVSPLTPPECPAGADPTLNPPTVWLAHKRAVRDWKRHFTDQYEWLAGVFGVLGRLPHDWHDDAVGRRLFQPAYPSARRHVDATPNLPVYRPGKAFDWKAALEATGYTPSQLTKPRTEIVATQDTANAWLEAVALDGLIVPPGKPQANGNIVLRCPWEVHHSAPGGSGTVLYPDGRFHCSHRSHGTKTNADLFATLSRDAQRVITGERDTAGVQRVRERLALHGADIGQTVTLDRVAVVVDEILTAWKPGQLTVIAATPGSGKNRAVNAHVVHRKGAVVIAPNHDLCAQHTADIRTHTIAKVQHRRGVLSTVDGDGRPLCVKHAAASAVQAAGGDVSTLVCRSCPSRPGCPAIRAAGQDSGAKIVVTVPQLADSARASLANTLDTDPRNVLVVYDEGVELFSTTRLSPEDLHVALTTLDADAFKQPEDRDWNAFHVEPLRHVIHVLGVMQGGQVAVDGACQLVAHVRPMLPRLSRPMKPPLPPLLDAAVSQYVREPLGFESGLRLDAPPLADRPDDALAIARTLRVVIAMADLVRTLDAKGVGALEWIDGHLIVRGLTLAARDVAKHGGVLTDATPRRWELSALHPSPNVVRLDVPDRHEGTARVIKYSKRLSRKGVITPDGVAWDLIAAAIADVLARCAPSDRVLFVTYKVVADGLRAGVIPVCWPVWDVAHYGAARGSNRWETWECVATLGDPIANLGLAVADIEAAAARAGVVPTPEEIDECLRQTTEGELLQAHARVRDASRRAGPARHVHVGRLAPAGWHDGNATLEWRPPGRPRTHEDLLREGLEAGLSRREAAALAGVSKDTCARMARGLGL